VRLIIDSIAVHPSPLGEGPGVRAIRHNSVCPFPHPTPLPEGEGVVRGCL